MSRLCVLIVDDDANILRFVASILRAAGYDVLTAADGERALALAEDESVDVVILDLMLPDIDGLEVCRRLRAACEIPIIVLSAKGEDWDKVDALDLGADDYLTKPFSTVELLARVRAVLRRARREGPAIAAQRLTSGEFELDPETRRVTICGRATRLSRTEFNLLHYLVRHAGKTVPHNVLLNEVWGPEYRQQTEYLHVYIGRLRQRLEPDPASPRYLLTESGFGYVFRPEPPPV